MSYHMGSIWYELWGGCSYGFPGVTTFFVSWNRLLVWCCKFFVARCRVFTCHMRNTLLSASFRGGCRCSRIFWGQRRVLVFSIAVVAPHEHSTHKHPNLWGMERRRFKGCISRYSTGWGRESSSLYLLRFSCSSPTYLWKLFMSSWSGRALLCSRKFFWCRWWRGGFRDSWKVLKFYVSILLCAGCFLRLLFSGNYSFLLPVLCVRWVCPGRRGSWRLLCGRFCLVRRRLGYVLGYGCVLCSGGRWMTHWDAHAKALFDPQTGLFRNCSAMHRPEETFTDAWCGSDQVWSVGWCQIYWSHSN